MLKILFVCNDFIGKTMAGPGIRYWELAHALERKGHRAVILSRHLEEGFSGEKISYIGRASFANLIVEISRSDAVILPGSPIAILLSLLLRKRLIFDQYDPVIFEFLEQRPRTLANKLRKAIMLLLWRLRQRMILKFGHGFLVANEKQKDFLIGQLTVLGHAKKLDTVIVLPFGLPDRKPGKSQPVLRGSRIKETDFLLIWGGGIWDWFDPITLLHALAKIASQRNDIKTYFPGLMPPNPDSRKMAAVDHFLSEARRLGLLDTTLFVNTGWTSYDARGNYLLEADAGISLHRDSIEARFAFRTRILDYLWAGLPIVASKGDSWAEQIDANGLGITVPCENAEAVKHAILKMADDKVFRQQCKQRVLSLVPGYVWDNLVTRMNL